MREIDVYHQDAVELVRDVQQYVVDSHIRRWGETKALIDERLSFVQRRHHARVFKSQLHATRYGIDLSISDVSSRKSIELC